MEREVPAEIRVLQERFWSEQRAREAAKQAEKKVNPKKQKRQEAKLKKPMRPSEFDKVARSYGASCEGGRGKHAVHVVLNNGQERSVPQHRVLSPGVQRSLINSLQQSTLISNSA